HDMDAFAARQFDEALELLRVEPVTGLLRGGDNLLPADAFAGIEIEDDAIAQFEAPHSRAADMNLQRAELSELNQIAELFHRDHVVLLRLDTVAQRRVFDVRRDMLLKKAFAGYAVRTAHNRERPTDQMRRHQLPDVNVVFRQILFGDPDIGPVHPIRMGQVHVRDRALRARAAGASWRHCTGRPRFALSWLRLA